MGAVSRPPAIGSGFDGATCVVTGGLGFIGSNTARALLEAGADVRVIDALVPQHGGDRRNLPSIVENAGDDVSSRLSVTIGNIANDELMRPVLAGADYVFNIAGQVSHLESMINPLHDHEINVRSQLVYLESVRATCPSAVVVHTSTRQVYGRPRYLPVDEAHPTEPRDINGVDKLAGEQYHRLYGWVHGIATVALRLTNVYGPRQNLTQPGLGFLPVFVRRALRGEPLTVYGEGLQRRDCLHVDDVVDVLLLAAQVMKSGGIEPGTVCNVGSDEALSLRSIAETMAEIGGSGSSVEFTPWPPELAAIDIGDFSTDASFVAKALGWTPRLPFRTGIEMTLDFYRRHSWYLPST